MKYMLDTNIIIFLKEKNRKVLEERLRETDPDDVCISAITYAELEYGIEHSNKKEQNRLAIIMALSGIEIQPFDSSAAYHYGKVRQELTSSGEIIGANDMLIAAHAISQDLTLITNNIKEFQRVKGLKVEDWTV